MVPPLSGHHDPQPQLRRVRHLLRDDHTPKCPQSLSPTVIARHHDLHRLHNSDRVIQSFLLDLSRGLFSFRDSDQHSHNDYTAKATLEWFFRGTFDLAGLSALSGNGSRSRYDQAPLYQRLNNWKHRETASLNVDPLMDIESTGGALVVVQCFRTLGDTYGDPSSQSREGLCCEAVSLTSGFRQLPPGAPSFNDNAAPLRDMSITSRSLRVRKTGCSPETVSTFSGSDPHVASSDRTAPAYYALSPIVAVLKTTEFNAIFGYLHTFTHLISAYVACGCQLALWGQGVRFSRHLMLNERTVLVEINDDINEPRVIGDIDAFLSYISGNPEPLPRSYGDPYNPDLEAFEDAWDILRTAVMAVLDIPLDAPLQRLRQPTGKMLDQWRHKFGGVRRGEPSASRAPDIENRWAEDDHLGEANDYLYPTTDVQSSPLRQTWFRDEFQHAAWEDAWREKRERETFIGLRAAIRQEGTIFVGGGRSVFRVLLREMRESL